MNPNNNRAESARLINIAAKLLTARDFPGSKTFAVRARESDPTNPESNQILAVIDTVLAGENRVDPSHHPDWYAVLQLPRLVRDPDLIADHYRRLLLLLSPDSNSLPFADYAFQLVIDAWSILSDPNKKWLFDNQLTLHLHKAVASLQTHPPPAHQHQQQQQQQSSAAAAASAQDASQVNTFQFFQQPAVPAAWQQEQQQQQHVTAAPTSTFQFFQQTHPPVQQMWQQQEIQQSHQRAQNSSSGSNTVNHLHQIEFMQPVQQVQVPVVPQWQVREPVAVRVGEGNKGVLNEISTGVGVMRPVVNTQWLPGVGPSVVVPAQAGNVTVEGTRVDDGVSFIDNSKNSSHADVGGVVNEDVVDEDVVDDENDEGVEVEVEVETVECFWTSCPYCLYIYEYQKVYQECTLRCQNCKRGFQAVQIPNPPPISGGSNGAQKDKKSSFCCWGFFPLGFSTAVWKKNNQMGKSNVASNWVPFSPMFATPVPVEKNDGGNFQWFDSSAGASVGPKNVEKPPVSRPRVYRVDDYDDDFISDPSDSDSSDEDWRRKPGVEKKKSKKKRANFNSGGRPRRVKQKNADAQNPPNPNTVAGGGVSTEDKGVEDGTATQNVGAGLTDMTLKRNQARRKVKNMGKLDLNVEFNNEGDEHAPTADAVNGEDDAIANIGFFEGLDEFFSTLPILNVGGEEKAKPS